MRVAIVGATGNVGTSLLESLAREPSVESVLGIARRLPRTEFPKTEWRQADIRSDDLVPLFRGADAVVHLAWAIQPSRDDAALRATNLTGSARVLRAVGEAHVPALVYASSVGTYSPGPKDRFVDERWPVDGIATSFYSRHKAEVERMLDRFEAENKRRSRRSHATGLDLQAHCGIRDPAAVRRAVPSQPTASPCARSIRSLPSELALPGHPLGGRRRGFPPRARPARARSVQPRRRSRPRRPRARTPRGRPRCPRFPATLAARRGDELAASPPAVSAGLGRPRFRRAADGLRPSPGDARLEPTAHSRRGTSRVGGRLPRPRRQGDAAPRTR